MSSPISYSEKKRQQVAVSWASLIAGVQQQRRNCEVELVEDVVKDAVVDEDEGIDDEVGEMARIAAHYEELLVAQRLESEHESAIIAAHFRDLLRAQRVELELESLRIAAHCDDFIEAERATMHAQFAGQLEAQRLDSEAERARIVKQAAERLDAERATMNAHHLDEQIRLVQEGRKQAVLVKRIQGELEEAKLALSQIQVTAVDSLPLISFVYAFVCVLSAVLLVFWNISDFTVAHGICLFEWDTVGSIHDDSRAHRVLHTFHLTVMTMTTVGYGDYAFGTVLGRLFAMFWIPFGTTFCTVAMSVMIASFVGLISG